MINQSAEGVEGGAESRKMKIFKGDSAVPETERKKRSLSRRLFLR